MPLWGPPDRSLAALQGSELQTLLLLFVFWVTLKNAFSKAFIDYSTSGLENPLSHVLVLLGSSPQDVDDERGYPEVAIDEGEISEPETAAYWAKIKRISSTG